MQLTSTNSSIGLIYALKKIFIRITIFLDQLNMIKSFFKTNVIIKFINSDVFLFGASSSGLKSLNTLISLGFDKKKLFFIDSDSKKIGNKFCGIDVLPLKKVKKNSKILITSALHEEIEIILKKNGYNNYSYYHDLIWREFLEEKFSKNFLKIFNKAKSKTYLSIDEVFTIYDQLNRTEKIKGNIAEVGTYRGGTAFIISSVIKKTNKKFLIFDTFEGLPNEDKRFRRISPKVGWLADLNLEEVKKFILSSKIKKNSLIFKKGIFPNTTKNLKNYKYSLIHLDTDLYSSTISSLKYFYPRLTKGGCIISHDYNSIGCPGVKIAFQEFIKQKRLYKNLMQISSSQCILFKY